MSYLIILADVSSSQLSALIVIGRGRLDRATQLVVAATTRGAPSSDEMRSDELR